MMVMDLLVLRARLVLLDLHVLQPLGLEVQLSGAL